MEAYEALENDMAKEIDKAVGDQAERLEDAEARLKVTEDELQAQLEVVKTLQDQLEMQQVRSACPLCCGFMCFPDLIRAHTTQKRTEEAEELAEKMMSGKYGLGDAVQDVKILKERLKAEQRELGEKVTGDSSMFWHMKC